MTHKYVERRPKGKYGEYFKTLTHYHSHLKNITEIPRQGPARSRLPRQKRELGEDFAADRVKLLGGGHRAAVRQCCSLQS